MRKDKSLAIKLRKKGKSYNQISQLLHVPKSTLSGWFSKEEWSGEIGQQLQEKAKIASKERIKGLNVIRQIRLEEFYLKADQEAREEFLKNKKNTLFVSGIMLYWGEGDKKFSNGLVRVSNTDPYLLKTLRNFLIKFGRFPLEKIKGWILLYPDLNRDVCLNYWSREVGILKSNFIKSTIIIGRHKTKRSLYGTCTIYVGGKYFKKKMLKWIDLYKEDLVKFG